MTPNGGYIGKGWIIAGSVILMAIIAGAIWGAGTLIKWIM
jgi:hypothetical protein